MLYSFRLHCLLNSLKHWTLFRAIKAGINDCLIISGPPPSFSLSSFSSSHSFSFNHPLSIIPPLPFPTVFLPYISSILLSAFHSPIFAYRSTHTCFHFLLPSLYSPPPTSLYYRISPSFLIFLSFAKIRNIIRILIRKHSALISRAYSWLKII